MHMRWLVHFQFPLTVKWMPVSPNFNLPDRYQSRRRFVPFQLFRLFGFLFQSFSYSFRGALVFTALMVTLFSNLYAQIPNKSRKTSEQITLLWYWLPPSFFWMLDNEIVSMRISCLQPPKSNNYQPPIIVIIYQTAKFLLYTANANEWRINEITKMKTKRIGAVWARKKEMEIKIY